jgi:hypothetical protein
MRCGQVCVPRRKRWLLDMAFLSLYFCMRIPEGSFGLSYFVFGFVSWHRWIAMYRCDIPLF